MPSVIEAHDESATTRRMTSCYLNASVSDGVRIPSAADDQSGIVPRYQALNQHLKGSTKPRPGEGLRQSSARRGSERRLDLTTGSLATRTIRTSSH